MPSCRARRMSERRLESEDIDSPLYRVCGMAVPQLVWVNVEPCGPAPLPANISNCLACEMPIPPGTREDELFIRAAAKSLKEVERCWRYANSASLGSFAEEVNLASAIENLDVFPTDSRDLRDPATQQVTPLNQGVVAWGVGVLVSVPNDGREQQAHLFNRKATGRRLGVELRPARDRVPRNTGSCRP